MLDCLFIKIPEHERIRLLWSLLNDRQQDNKALCVLLIKIGQLSPNIPKHVLKELLDKQPITSAILLKVMKRNKLDKGIKDSWIHHRAAIIKRQVYEGHGCKPLLGFTKC